MPGTVAMTPQAEPINPVLAWEALRSTLRSSNLLAVALVALGITSISTQIVLLREFLSVFYGNELVIGIVLANWLILTGVGSFLGRFSERYTADESAIPLSLVTLGLLPPATVALLRFLRNIVFTPGSMIGIIQAFVSSLVLLAPYCLVSGFSFTYFTTTASRRRGANLIALSYSWESLGSAAGGFLFSLVLVPLLGTFQALGILLVFDLGLAFTLAWSHQNRLLQAVSASLLCAAAFVTMFANLDAVTRRVLFPGQELVYFKDTPYGNPTVTRQGDQMNFFENNVLMFSTNEVTTKEENVHYALAQRSALRRVLLIGGGISGTAQEILKYGVESVEYAEVNPWIISIGRAFTHALDDARIHVINDDARRYVRRSSELYDAALINLPDPSTAHLNRYYTVEFFRELKHVLSDSAVVSTSLLPAAEYQGPEAKRLSSALYATLRKIFTNLLIVPGERNYFLASDGPLDIHIGRLIDQRGISTAYVNRYYIDDQLLEQRSREIVGSLEGSSEVNTDFAPVCYYQQLAYWLSYFGFSPGPLILLAVIALMLGLWKFSAVGAGIFAGGFSASALEIILLIAFQTLYGSLYQMTGIVIAAFMAGLALGSWVVRRIFPRPGIGNFIGLQLVVAGSCLLLPLVLSWLRGADLAPVAVHLVFTALAFIIAALIGMEFAVASVVRGGSVASVAAELYGLDLAGSATGALIVTAYAIPSLGMTNVSLLVGLVSGTGAAICFLRRTRYRVQIV